MIEDAHSLLSKVMDLLLDPICVVDAEGRFVFVSAACERLFGYTQEELIGRNMIELVYPEDRERTLSAAAEIMDDQPKMHFENRYVRKDGQIVHIMWSARWSESDRIRLAVARDVTELKHAERMQSAVYRISEAAHAADGLHELCRHIHQIIGDLLPANNFYVALKDESGDRLTFPYYVNERKQAPESRPLIAGSPSAEVIGTGRALLKTSRETATSAEPESTAQRNYLDWLGVPLISQKGVIGALVLKTYSGGVRYTEEDKDLLQFVSTQIATVIERKQAEARLHHMAHHDALTDLPNRTLFNDRFDMALKRARRNKEHLALLCLDLNGFKDINDTFGHGAGDQMLREVAQRLVGCVRESDTIGRMGGDEFIVLLTNIQGPDDADIIVEKIANAFSTPFELDGRSVALSASIGTAVYPEQGEDLDELFHHADAGMYTVKRRGS
jgi:diguanylate cyclase (GGDEF)-like protein/PAS domain S-box-containing protein